MNNEELFHYGVKGMKWGVRRARKASSSSSKSSARKKEINRNIKDYRKSWDEAEKASNAADKKRQDVSSQYKALGKNRLQRFMAVSKGNSDAVKKYKKDFNEATRLEDIADKKWNEVSEKYKLTGKNRVSRILNNIKYDRK